MIHFEVNLIKSIWLILYVILVRFILITKILVVFDARELHFRISNFSGYSRVWETPGWSISLRPRRPTDERVMPIRFGYHGRLAGTYEKISFPAYVTTNWYEATLLPCTPRYFIMYSYYVIERSQIVGALTFGSHWFRVTLSNISFQTLIRLG